MHLRYLPHLVNVGLLLLELGEGCLDFGNDLVIVGRAVWKACWEVEAWNVYGGRRRGDHHFGWRRGGGARGRGGRSWSWRWRRTSGFLLWLDLDREREMEKMSQKLLKIMFNPLNSFYNIFKMVF